MTKLENTASTPVVKRGRGRPKGSANKNKALKETPSVQLSAVSDPILESIKAVSQAVVAKEEVKASSNTVNPIIVKARSDIQKVIDQNGRYTHNLIGMVLRKVKNDLSVKAANDLIDEFNITALCDIQKMPETISA